MISQFFIDRPVFAWVLAIVLMLAGGIAAVRLPVMQYPTIAPPQVAINVNYPGASAQTVQDTVVQVIEQQLNGIDNLDYITSDSNSDGTAQITLTFTQSANPDIAQVQVQNKLQLAMPLLPQEVQQQGIRVNKPTRNFLVVLGFISANDSMSSEDIGDYVATNILDPLNRTPGVGDVQLFGSQYAMRIWLDPDKLNNFGLTSGDIVAAIKAQNVQVSAGQIGGLPAVPGQQITAAIIGPTRLSTPEEFRQILVRVNPDGSQLKLGDVARVAIELRELCSATSSTTASRPPASAIRLATGANALDTVERDPQDARPARAVLSARLRSRVPARHDAVRAHVDRGRRDHAGRGDRPRVRGDLPVPAEPARDADPDDRGADRAARHVRRALGASATRSTRSRCSAWCCRSACSSTTRSSSSRTSSG